MPSPSDCTTLRKLSLKTWYKIKWTEGKHSGKIDLMREDAIENYRSSLDVLEEIKTESCAKGIRLGWGITEENEIDSWIKSNKITNRVSE